MKTSHFEYGIIPGRGTNFFLFPNICFHTYGKDYLYGRMLSLIWGNWYLGFKWKYQP